MTLTTKELEKIAWAPYDLIRNPTQEDWKKSYDALRQLESSLRAGETDQAAAVLEEKPRPEADGAAREAFEQLRALLKEAKR